MERARGADEKRQDERVLQQPRTLPQFRSAMKTIGHGGDPKLVEMSPRGVIPRIGALFRRRQLALVTGAVVGPAQVGAGSEVFLTKWAVSAT